MSTPEPSVWLGPLLVIAVLALAITAVVLWVLWGA